MTATAGSSAQPKRGWRTLILAWLCLSVLMGALNGKHPEDLTWLAGGAVQGGAFLVLGIVAAALLGLVLLRLAKRLDDLAGPTLLAAATRCFGLGLVYAVGQAVGVWLGGGADGRSALAWAISISAGALLMGAAIFVFSQLFRSRRTGRRSLG